MKGPRKPSYTNRRVGEAHYAWAKTLRAQKEVRPRRRRARTGDRAEPQLSRRSGELGLVKIFLGRAIEGFAPIEKALRLSPRDPNLSAWLTWFGVAHMMLGEDERAVERAYLIAPAVNPLTM